MDEERKQSDGAIYTNNYKKSATQPDWTGKITLDRDLLKDLVKRVQEGEEAVWLCGIGLVRMAMSISMLAWTYL